MKKVLLYITYKIYVDDYILVMKNTTIGFEFIRSLRENGDMPCIKQLPACYLHELTIICSSML